MFQLIRYFSITSLVAMVLGGTLLAIHFDRLKERSILEMGEHQNIAMTKAFSNALWPSLHGFLNQTMELEPRQIKDHTMMIPYLDTLLGRLMQDLDVVKIKIFNTNGITIYSTQPDQIGTDQVKNVGFVSAINGEPKSNLIHRNGFPSFDGVVEDRDMISTYVPLTNDGQIKGVIELYYDITKQIAHHDQSRLEIVFGVFALFSILYLALFGIIRKADLTIKSQNKQLTASLEEIRINNETLEQKIEERIETQKITNEVLKTEIQERHQAEGELRKLTQAVEQSPATVLITDLEGNIEYVNPKFCQVTGYSRSEVKGKKPSILKSGMIAPDTYGEMWGEIRKGREWRGEFHNRRKDGSLFWESASISPIRNKKGDITHYVAVKEDITEFKAAQNSLKNSELRLRTILDSVVEGIVGVKENGEIESCNPAMVRIFGYSEFELVGSNVRGLIPEPHSSAHDGYLQGFLATTKPGDTFEREGMARRKGGEIFPIELGVIRIHNNSPIRFIATVRDISERKQAEKELALSRQNHAHHEKMASIGTLAAGILHEINNPTAVITGLLEALQDNLGTDADEETTTYIDLMVEQISRISNITRDVSDLATPQAEEIQLVDINSLVEKTSNLMHFDKRMQTIKLSLELDRDMPAISASASQLRQVIINLLLNAADAINEGDKQPQQIHIKTSIDKGEHDSMRLTIRDNGIGMSSETIEKALDPFFTTKPAGKGTGLGLSLCYSIIEKHNGTIEIESQLGEGSDVHVLLPLENSQFEGN